MSGTARKIALNAGHARPNDRVPSIAFFDCDGAGELTERRKRLDRCDGDYTRPGVPRSPGLVASSGSRSPLGERPAPRCKRRRYRCAVHAQPIRISTVRYSCAYSLRVSRTRDRKTRPDRPLHAQQSVSQNKIKNRLPRGASHNCASAIARVAGRAFARPAGPQRRGQAAFYRLSNGIYCWYSFGTELR